MKKITIFIIRFYQKILSPDTGLPKKLGLVFNPVCIFYPSCSEYMVQAISKYGLWLGLKKGFKRLSKCSPKQDPCVDLP